MEQFSVTTDHRAEIENRMRREGMPELAIRTFVFYYEQLLEGATGLISEDSIRPVDDLPDQESLSAEYEQLGQKELSRAVVLKLNGGLGTTMGLRGAKSLLKVRGELTFLDIIARQAMHWGVPLVLMNSFSTVRSSRLHLNRYSELKQDVPFDFVQHKVPKITQHDGAPVEWSAQPSLEWCPPGHGDIYTALLTSGTLNRLREAGFQYLFVSNSDNLGAVLDASLLGYFCGENLPFMMEVADRSFADRKGGHLALDERGQLLLRESAQCPAEELPLFQNVERHRYFNTNNLWIRLDALHDQLEQRSGIMGLPMIRNAKTVDPCDASSTPVFQLETAMGAAIAVFEGAGAIRVPRSRFAPVKTTNELLAIQSDACTLNDDHSLTLHSDRAGTPCTIDLDRAHYRTVGQIKRRFPHGAPSLRDCETLTVEGDVKFGAGVKCHGRVSVVNRSERQAHVADGCILEGTVYFD